MFAVLGLVVAAFLALFSGAKTPASPADDPTAGRQIPDPSQMRDEAFVTDLHVRILGRQPDPEGFAGHVDAWRRGMPRRDVAHFWYHSPEFLAKQDPQPGTGPARRPPVEQILKVAS